ncbi:MAG: hypothetical protein JW395_2168 [Nitrospira sp.]|nr:hypothetical protein [Nitrospira sp.]
MPFRLRSDAEKWFSEIDGREPVKTKFDLYYFCLMAGLAHGRSTDPAEAGISSKEIVDDFIQDYKPAKRLLIGLLVVAEVRKGGISLDERASVRDIFKRLVTFDTKTGLTDEGMRCMNAYASGGYEFLAESRETKPASPEEFLRDYVRLVNEAASKAT